MNEYARFGNPTDRKVATWGEKWAVAALVSVLLALGVATGAENSNTEKRPDTAELLSLVLPQFEREMSDEGAVFRFTYPLALETFDRETTPVYSRWNVKVDEVQRLDADLNSNGREEVYVAFQTRIASAQNGSSAVARWLCVRGFERTPDEKTDALWQPLLIERQDRPHFADRIERFEIVDLGKRKALCVQNAFTDAQATPRNFSTDFAVYILRNHILVPILKRRIAHGCYGGGGVKPYRWDRHVGFHDADESGMRQIRIAEARELQHSETSADWLPSDSTARLANDPIPGLYRWVPAQFRYLKWE